MKKNQTRKIYIGRYIEPLSDYGFDRLLGNEANKECLIDFLNELFKDRKIISDITYNKNEHPGPQSKFRKSIFDLTCTGQDGGQFIIEVQNAYQLYFKDRAVYYNAALIHEQGPKGNGKWDFRLGEVYVIALMNFGFKESLPETHLHWVHLAEDTTGEIFYKKLGYVFIEIPKFRKQGKDLKTGLDQWLFVFKNMSRLKKSLYF